MLQENLPIILEQDYPQFEVIVVNDQSVGEDEDTLKLLENRYHHLYHTFIPQTARYISRKKLGIAMGIKASKYDWIVVTEPHCKPLNNRWLQSLAKHFTPQTDIVLGYSSYLNDKKRFFNYIKTDNLFQAMRFLGMALAGKPYMGIGRNLAYRKKLYEQHKGFYNHLNLQRGDDDLFINTVATPQNTQVATEPDSIMYMPLPPYKRNWLEEKINLQVTGHYYKGNARLLNCIETWTCALFHLSVACGLIITIVHQAWIFTGVIGTLWLIRLINQTIVFRRTAKDLQENLCCMFPLFDLFRPLGSLQTKIRYWRRNKTDFLRKQ